MNKNAVILICDENYLPPTCFFADQISNQSLRKNFDIIIASAETCDLPETLKSKGVSFKLLQNVEKLQDLKTHPNRLPITCYYDLLVPDLLGDRYERVLYLDSDMYLEGGDLAEIFDVDMQECSVAAVRDVQQWNRPLKHVYEFDAAGLSAAPYFNSGLLLFDTQKYIQDDVLNKCLEFGLSNPDALLHHDQSLLNIILHKNWCELSPLWNWQYTIMKPFFTITQPIRISHFLGDKPWSDPKGACPPRYWNSMKPYILKEFPNWSGYTKSPQHQQNTPKKFIRRSLDHLMVLANTKRNLSRFCSDKESFIAR